MKKINCFILSMIALAGMACMKDKSTFNTKEVQPIVIDTTGIDPRFVVFQFDTLQLAPAVRQEGMKGSLRYKWTMNAYGGYERVVGTEARLKARITEVPSSSPYALIFTVTDTLSGLKAFFSWNINVNSPFGQGMIVADTKDDVLADLHLIMAFHFNPVFGSDSASAKVIMNAYSQSNSGSKIGGPVRQLNYMRYYSKKDITLLTDRSYIRIDPNSYQLSGQDNDLFVLAPQSIQPTAIQTAIETNQHQYLVNGNKAYGRYGETRKFGYSFLAPDPLGYSCSKVLGLQAPHYSLQTAGIVYDEKNSRFLLLPRMTAMASPLVAFRDTDFSDPVPAFDPNHMGGKICLELLEGYDQRIISIMKSSDGTGIFAYQIKLTEPLTGKMGVAANDLSGKPDISQAKFFACSRSEQVLFYATEQKIYATVLETGAGGATGLRYTVPAGEKITGMKMHRGGGRMYLPEPSAPGDWNQRRTVFSADRLLVISTYNEGTREGKIVAIPLELLGIGGLVTDPAYIRTYGGFGRITEFSPQAD